MVSHGLGGAPRPPPGGLCLAGSLWRLPSWPLVPALCLCFCALSHATQAVLAHLMGSGEGSRESVQLRAGGASTKCCEPELPGQQSPGRRWGLRNDVSHA